MDEAIYEVPTSWRGLIVSHLFFADDSLLFCRAKNDRWEKFTELLHLYEKASGQKMNHNKTTIFFQ
jgi:hypothetical protein